MLVAWRPAATGAKASRLVPWREGPQAANTAGGIVTKEEARKQAEHLRSQKKAEECAYRLHDREVTDGTVAIRCKLPEHL